MQCCSADLLTKRCTCYRCSPTDGGPPIGHCDERPTLRERAAQTLAKFTATGKRR